MGGGIDGSYTFTDSDGNPNVFNLERNEDGLWLNNNWTNPDNRWNPDNEFFFRFRYYFFPRLNDAVFILRTFQFFLPTAEHPANFLQFYRQFLALAVGN